uniref:Amidase domain-containing protein n=1 Tax=Fusarium oxysporum (strain Fo5176) TaxID=660025 RepID=A0A0D2XPK7_FUSOF
METKIWEQVVAEKRRQRARVISAFVTKNLSDNEDRQDAYKAITEVDDISALADKISSGDLTEILFDDVLEQAQELDAYYAKEKKTKGPLHGVPISLKDQFNVKCYDTTLGYTSKAFKPAKDDAVLWAETDNPLWGLTENPIIPRYTPGGSSGGESALIYSHGSLGGFGSDLGGSIRMPASMMGLYGFKPSVMDAYFTVDGGEDIRRDVEAGGEPFIPSVERLVNRGKPISVFDYWQLNKRKRELQQAYLEKWNNTLSKKGKTVDAIIMPALPHAAVPHNTVKWVGYTKVWNLLDYTALVIPGGKVEAKDLDALWDHEPRNELDEWNTRLWEDNMQEMAKHHLPVDIQIVGRVLEEEKVLAVGKVLDDLLRTRLLEG